MNIIKKRSLIEFAFSKLALSLVLFTILVLSLLLVSMGIKAYSAFVNYKLNIHFSNEEIAIIQKDPSRDNFLKVIESNIIKTIDFHKNIDIDNIASAILISEINNFDKWKKSLHNNTYKILLNSDTQMYLKGYAQDHENKYLLNELMNAKLIQKAFNVYFFLRGDSRQSEIAGIRGSIVGSLYTILLTMFFSIIIGVGAAIYLQEFAPKNKFIDFLELNINNLASIPSIIYGLLGLLVFQQFFHIPRSSSILASLVLTLMALPTIVISTRVALSGVSKNIREAAYGIGSSKVQVILLHLLPISFPGILTGIIISLSRVAGETAPLLMIGMVSFISGAPHNVLEPASVLPVQIYLWSTSPEIGFVEKTSAAIIVLLIFLALMNSIAIYLRYKFEQKL